MLQKRSSWTTGTTAWRTPYTCTAATPKDIRIAHDTPSQYLVVKLSVLCCILEAANISKLDHTSVVLELSGEGVTLESCFANVAISCGLEDAIYPTEEFSPAIQND